MSFQQGPAAVQPQLGQVRNAAAWRQVLARPWPLAWRIVAVLVLYVMHLYLPHNSFRGDHDGLPYDAGHYWELALQFQRHVPQRVFSLLFYNNALRGYLGPLSVYPALVWRHITGCTMMQAAQVEGAVWAVVLFAGAGPWVWRSVGGRPVAGGRWLLWLLVCCLFWRDHFSFTHTDLPALTLLLLGIAALQRPGLGAWLLAGACLAAAANMRPVYVIGLVPALGLALWWQRRHGGRPWRLGALLLAGALLWAPQLLINWRYFHVPTPLVLAQYTDDRASLYLLQLSWGTRVQLYSTAVTGCVVYADDAGIRMMRAQHLPQFRNYSEFFAAVAAHPIAYVGRYARHIFNGLDVRYASPYVGHLVSREPWLLRLVNYPLLGVGLLMAWRYWRRRASARGPWTWIVLTILLPCAGAVPVAVENRFFLPLHILLLALALFGFEPAVWRRWLAARPSRGWRVALVGGGWLVGCWALSLSTDRALYGPAGTGYELVETSFTAPIP